MQRAISIDTIREAARSVYGAALRTPLVPLGPIAPNAPEIFLKLETLQPIGSFKIRGAYNAVRRLTPEQLARGVWTVSAGNAAQGVALAARHAGAPCSVMVMDTAPETKLRAIDRLGATIVKATYDECWRTVEDHGSPRMAGHFVHPFDDDDFISGNGTAGSRSSRTCPTSTRSLLRSAAADCSPGSESGCMPCGRMRPCMRPNPTPPHHSSGRSQPDAPAVSRNGRHHSSTAPAASPSRPRCGRC